MSNACIGIFNFVDTVGGMARTHDKWKGMKT